MIVTPKTDFYQLLGEVLQYIYEDGDGHDRNDLIHRLNVALDELEGLDDLANQQEEVSD